MKNMKKLVLMGAFAFLGTMTLNATENVAGPDDIDTTYIKLDENREPINHVNLTYDELVEKVGELETILETENFQLYAAGDYTYKIEGGVVTSMAIQIPDENNDKVVYKGPVKFAKKRASEWALELPDGLLKAGENEIIMINTTPDTEVDGEGGEFFRAKRDYYWGWFMINGLRFSFGLNNKQ